MQKRKTRENDKKNWLVRLLGKFYSSDQPFLLKFTKRLLILLLFFIEGLIVVQQFSTALNNQTFSSFFITLFVVCVFSVNEILKFFVVRSRQSKGLCYFMSAISLFCLTILAGTSYLTPLCIVLLTEIYISSKKMIPSAAFCALGMVLYHLTFWIAEWVHRSPISVVTSLTRSLSNFIIIVVHFVVVNIAVRFYLQYVRLKETMRELAESKRKLERAYADLAEVTALEERQRIAKEIHDTTGHSIMTVIMQTESAKLMIDEKPEEAKTRIVSANLQAKLALDELRRSVHLLSGIGEITSVKMEFERIIRESMDGTNINIRSKLEEIELPQDYVRLLSNALKEGISNGIRHGNATAFWVALESDKGGVSFLISDNGNGCKNVEKRKGFGLKSMEKSVEEAGGRFSLFSEQEEGFEIKIWLPNQKREGT